MYSRILRSKNNLTTPLRQLTSTRSFFSPPPNLNHHEKAGLEYGLIMGAATGATILGCLWEGDIKEINPKGIVLGGMAGGTLGTWTGLFLGHITGNLAKCKNPAIVFTPFAMGTIMLLKKAYEDEKLNSSSCLRRR